MKPKNPNLAGLRDLPGFGRGWRARLLGSFLLVILTSIGVVGLGLALLAPPRLDELGVLASRRRAFRLAPFLAERFQQTGSWTATLPLLEGFAAPFPPALAADITLFLPLQPEVVAALNQDRLVLINPTGQVVADSQHTLAVGQPLPPELQRYAVPITLPGRTVGSLVLVSGLEQAISALVLTALQRTLWGAGLLAAMLATLVSLALAQRLVVPLQRLNQATRRLASGDSHEPLPVATTDEIGALTVTFNEMAQALETQKRLRRHMVADIAHELRTPLSIMQLELESLTDGLQEPIEAAASLGEEVNRLSRLVEDLRLLSLAEAGGLHFTLERLDPAAFLHQILATWTPVAQTQQVALQAAWPTALPPISADAGRLGQVFNNLLGNALRYTPAGGAITLGARVNNQTFVDNQTFEVLKTSKVSSGVSSIVFWVADSGPGIAPPDLPYVFERFYRADSSRSRLPLSLSQDESGGSGLGLAIAKQWITLHGGRIWVESEPGHGATFFVALPVVG